MRIIRVLLLSLAALFAGAAPAADPPVKVVYHLSDGVAQASRAIGNIRNHLSADPSARIVVVTHGAGIDFLLEGAETTQGQKFAGAVAELANRGVEFKVCNNTLVSRGIGSDKVVMEAKVVPSGVAEIARLQAREGFVYLRP
jgi:intracellular sulfur oxidation DsrE/DsrF family protein